MQIHSNKRYEHEFVNLMVSKGYHCERVAGSGSGKNSVCDCILFKDGKVYLVEVKTTKEKEFCIKPNIRKQLERMKEVAEKCNIEWMLAVKLKRKGWRFYEDKKMGI